MQVCITSFECRTLFRKITIPLSVLTFFVAVSPLLAQKDFLVPDDC